MNIENNNSKIRIVWEQVLFCFKLLFRMPFTFFGFWKNFGISICSTCCSSFSCSSSPPTFPSPKKDLRKNGKSPITPKLCTRFSLFYIGYSVILAYCGFKHWVTVSASCCVIFPASKELCAQVRVSYLLSMSQPLTVVRKLSHSFMQ